MKRSSSPSTSHSGISRRDALVGLGGIALASLFGPASGQGAPSEPVTSEPTGNPGIDHNLAAFEAAPIQITKLDESLALVTGPGGNMTVLTGADGALLVDTGVHPAAAALVHAAETFAGKPLTLAVNTHWHFDHAGGNEFLGRRGVRLIAHEATRTRLGSDQTVEAFNFTFHSAPAIALPVVTFADNLTLHVGAAEVRLTHLPPAHTDGDVFLHFPTANVIQTGDVFFNGFYPFIDTSSGGWIGGMVGAADHILALCDDKTRIIPGHGPLGGIAELKAARDMLHAVQQNIERLLDAGKSSAEILAAQPTREFDAKWGGGFFKAEQFVPIVVSGIVKHRKG